MSNFLSRLKAALTNPKYSVRANWGAAAFWAVNFVIVVFMYFILPDAWEKISILYLALVSIYANFVGHLSAVEAAQGNKKQDDIEEKRAKEEKIRDENLVEKIDEITPDV